MLLHFQLALMEGHNLTHNKNKKSDCILKREFGVPGVQVDTTHSNDKRTGGRKNL